VENELERSRGQAATLKERWNREKSASPRTHLKEEQDRFARRRRRPAAQAIGKRPRKLRYGRLSQIEKDIQAAEHDMESVKETRAAQRRD
jgi:hypothetical protein